MGGTTPWREQVMEDHFLHLSKHKSCVKLSQKDWATGCLDWLFLRKTENGALSDI